MKLIKAPFLRIVILLLICQIRLSSQNVGIGATTPSAKLHLKSTVQEYTDLDKDFETGSIKEGNNTGDYDWFITSADGFNSAKSAKMPAIFNSNETAILQYQFNMPIGKQVTLTFNIKYDDPSDMVDFVIYSDHFNHSPSSFSTWESFTTTFVSTSTSDFLYFAIKANQGEAFPIVHIDNILVTYTDGHVLKIEDGSEGEGLVLQSDALGHTEWFDLRGEVDQKIIDNYQELEFDTIQNALFIENGNGVLISSLKNNNGKELKLSDLQLVGSQGMSLHLPSIGSDDASFHYDAQNNTMDWGIESDSLKGSGSTRWGFKNVASSTNTTSWGSSNNASGGASTSWGVGNISSGSTSTSWGFQNNSSGWRSTTWGRSNNATELNSTAFGQYNTSSGELATAWGENNNASGLNSTAWGLNNTASGWRSTAWGNTNTTSAGKGTVWGFNNTVSATEGTAWGNTNEITSSANASTACGKLNNASGFYSFVSGYRNDVNSFAEVAFGRYNNSTSGDNNSWEENDMLFSIGNGTAWNNRKNAVTVLKNGNVGIGLFNPSYDLHVASNSAAKPGSSSWTVSSDRRLKKDIVEFTDGLNIISAMEPVWFTYNGLAGIPEGTYVGTIAQELEQIAPYMVTEYTHRDNKGNSEDYKAVNYGAMDFILLNAIKEQQQEITELKAQIAEILALLDKNANSKNNSPTQ